MTDLEALEYTLKNNKTVPPYSCVSCHYYSGKYEHICNLLTTKEDVRRCVENDFKSGMRSIYLKEK